MDGQIAARLDRLPVTSLHRKLMWLVGIGVFFDLYDVFLAGIMVNVFKSTFGIGAGQQSAFIAAGFIGMFVGAAALGGLSDRYGRRTMYLVNLGIYSLFTLLDNALRCPRPNEAYHADSQDLVITAKIGPVKAILSALTGGKIHPHCSRGLNPDTCGFSPNFIRV